MAGSAAGEEAERRHRHRSIPVLRGPVLHAALRHRAGTGEGFDLCTAAYLAVASVFLLDGLLTQRLSP